MSSLRRLAIVNRGEPAMRCLAAARELADESGEPIITIALYTEPDAASWFVREADEAFCLGPAPVADKAGDPHSAYLDIDRLMTALTAARADSAWAGWGFVAESAELAARCEQAGITFIGPASDVIRLLGDKLLARQLAERLGIPVEPWSGGAVGDPGSARIAAVRHVEVQVIADGCGAVWAVGVRDCSIQRRNQKVFEESGCTELDAPGQRRLCEAAVKLCRAARYRGVGTVEFVLDRATRQFTFMRVNTRLQVEHPVTEMTTGLDLVKLQLHVAGGGQLPQSPPRARGYAIEARLNAEDPEHAFAPRPGRVAALRLPSGPGIRVDTGVAEGDQIAAELDSMIAKIVAWGQDRSEALSRLRRGLAQALVVIDGGTTNKAFLLALAGHPDMRAGTYDTQWLDRLTAADGLFPELDPVALVAAAIEAADTDQVAVQANFFATAARGRPVLPDAVGHRLRLRARGHGAHQVHVYRLGWDDYRVGVGGVVVDVHVERLGRYERALTCAGRRYKVVVVAQGPRLLAEVDGAPYFLARDDGGQVRCPVPAFVVAVLVAKGDLVRAGDPLVVVESMKTETTIAAPRAGLVSAVLSQVNTQVEVGAPLVRLQPPDQDAEPGSGGDDPAELERLADLASVAGSAGDSRHDDRHTLRAYLLGYDVEDDQARKLSREQETRSDWERLRGEQEVLEIFADVAALSRRVRADAEDSRARSSHEYLLSYLSILDAERSGTPDHFVRQLREALARYGVQSLARTPELEQALLRIYRSVGRMPAAAPIVIAILDRWRRAYDELAMTITDEWLSVLDRLIASTQGRYPEVCDLARDVRFCYVDAPVLKRTRVAAYGQIQASLDELSAHPWPERLRELTDRVVWFPLPMRATLRDRYRYADETTKARLLQVRTRRFYRIRDLNGLTCETFGGYLTCVADYLEAGHDRLPVHLVTAYVPLAELPTFASALAPHLSRLGAGRPVVVDVESWRTEPFKAAEDMAEELAELLARTHFGRDLTRLTVTVTSAAGAEHAEEHRRTQTFSYRQDGAEFAEETTFRNMHPMIAERHELWRLSNFSLTRLPSSEEDIYLFHAVAHANSMDERLIALAEVRDLTPARDSSGAIIGYPHLEGILARALADIRRSLRSRPLRQRSLSNRVVLYIRPLWDTSTATWRSLAHRLAPLAADLGLEEVEARIRIPDATTGDPREAVIDVENIEDRAVAVRLRPPADQPIEPLTEYGQKVLRARRLGLPYPYELIRMLTPPPGAPADFPPGEFVEYDLPDDDMNAPGYPAGAVRAERGGALVEVHRPYGRNRAGIVTGVITSYTPLVPEGMRRVALFGDPTLGLGNLAKAECRRILAALDLAARLRAPVEWFALSSGARIAWDSGTENMDWIAAVLRRLIEFTQSGGEVNLVITGINVGAQPYWNAEATMLMHTRGILVMTPASAMVLTGKSSLDYSGGVSAEDNFGIGGFERIMGPNGQSQYWAPTLAAACAVLLKHYALTYVVPGEPHPRRAPTSDPSDRSVCASPHKQVGDSNFEVVGDIFSADLNADRKKPFDMRSVMRAVADCDHAPLERWAQWRDAENAIVWDARIGGFPVCLIGIESQTVTRAGFVPADGPSSWTPGTLFPQSSRKLARAINAASGNRPVVVLANLTGFDGSPESMRKWQLEYGAEIGRAVTNFRGPIVFVVVSRYHGGAFVVFSKRLQDDMDTAAVAGSYASVIGGAPAAAVVMSRDVRARTDNDPRVVSLRAELKTATGKTLADLHHELARVVGSVRAEKLKEVADEFDAIHDIKRAMRVGSVDHIISPAQIRPFIVRALERRLTGATVALPVDPCLDRADEAATAAT